MHPQANKKWELRFSLLPFFFRLLVNCSFYSKLLFIIKPVAHEIDGYAVFFAVFFYFGTLCKNYSHIRKCNIHFVTYVPSKSII